MRSTFRSLCLGLLTLSGAAALAQNSVTVMGSVTPCSGTTYPIWIFSDPGTIPAVDTVINTTANCTYSYTFNPINTSGAVTVMLSCDGGATWGASQDTVMYDGSSIDTLVVDLGCGGTSCQACMSVSQAAPFTGFFSSCSTGGTAPFTYLWDFSDAGGLSGNPVTHLFPGPGIYTVCLNIQDAAGYWCNTCEQVVVDEDGSVSLFTPGPCQASFTVQQAMNGNTPIPWQMTTTNLSTGDAPLTYQWWMPDGSSSTEATPTFTFPQSGVYGICLTITSDNGNCTSTLCDTIAVDDMGMVSNDPIWFDCTGVLWGPNTSGTPCTTFLGEQGTWSDNCVCIADPSTGCQAGFWTVQAYDSTADGGVEPIPNEVWVWNLSSGGNGSYQFTWDFGDGDTSSDAYPTHEYDGPGPWLLCLTMYSGGCTDTYCDSVSVDENGILNGMTIENGGHPGTSNMAGRSNGFTLNVMHSSPTGISELPAIANLQVWPNPARNELNLTFSNTIAGTVPVTVIDPSGRVVIAEDHALTPGSNTLRLNIGPLRPGLYMVRIGNDARNARHRFMKVR